MFFAECSDLGSDAADGCKSVVGAGQGVAVKFLAGGPGPLAIALLPLYCVTFLGLGILAIRGDVWQKFRTAWRLRRKFFLAGICGQLMAQVGMTLGVSWSTASNGAIFGLLIPIFGALIAVWLLSLPVLSLLESHCLGHLAQLKLTQWAAFGYLAVFLYGVSMVLFLRALETVDVVTASASLYLMPLFEVALVFSILGERLAARAILGSAIVLFATLMLFRFDYAF